MTEEKKQHADIEITHRLLNGEVSSVFVDRFRTLENGMTILVREITKTWGGDLSADDERRTRPWMGPESWWCMYVLIPGSNSEDFAEIPVDYFLHDITFKGVPRYSAGHEESGLYDAGIWLGMDSRGRDMAPAGTGSLCFGWAIVEAIELAEELAEYLEEKAKGQAK
tara:strand:- start:445 stop:945 length:501 start_codon:yes stop_codon:yes gene_type:complete